MFWVSRYEVGWLIVFHMTSQLRVICQILLVYVLTWLTFVVIWCMTFAHDSWLWVMGFTHVTHLGHITGFMCFDWFGTLRSWLIGVHWWISHYDSLWVMSCVTRSTSHTGLGLREGPTIRRGLSRLGAGHEPSLLHLRRLKSQHHGFSFTIGFPLLFYDGLVA